jgi:hypothetical protein
MPILKTQEEILASKINPRNNTSALGVIYYLKNRSFADYVPSSPDRIVWGFSLPGYGAGTVKTFTGIYNTSNVETSTFARGATIVLKGQATYLLSSANSNIIKPVLGITAQIDIDGTTTSFPSKQVLAAATEIQSDGQFAFNIPSSITSLMAVGRHSVYLDGFSPKGTVRLAVANSTDDVRYFNITAS